MALALRRRRGRAQVRRSGTVVAGAGTVAARKINVLSSEAKGSVAGVGAGAAAALEQALGAGLAALRRRRGRAAQVRRSGAVAVAAVVAGAVAVAAVATMVVASCYPSVRPVHLHSVPLRCCCCCCC